jgi:signal transduction histidine kinase/HPt (histidine-containing phosphotransfer) domain-containing protein
MREPSDIPATGSDSREQRILIVDDEEVIRRNLLRGLARRGYPCREADSAAAARALLAAEPFALLMTDVRMPEESGIELMTHVAEHHPEVAIVLMTGHDDSEVAREAIEGGAHGYLLKPFEVRQAAVTIEAALERKRVLRGLAAEVERSERTLSLLSEQQRALLALIEDSFLLLDPHGLVLDANAAAARLVEPPRPTLVGCALGELVCPASREVLRRHLATVARGESGRCEICFAHPDGEAIHELSSTRLPDGRLLAIGRNITDRKRLEASLALAKSAAESADRAKSEFLANMSHEIRTPLNGVIGMTALLLASELNPDQRRKAEVLQRSGKALLSLISDILDLSKIEANRLELESIDFELRTTLAEVTELLSLDAREKGLELCCAVSPTVPATLRGDPGRLRQVLLNLGKNAVKFTPRGRVELEVTLVAEREGRCELRYEVRDEGIGIPAAKVDSLFSPFTQLDGSFTRRYGGSGLGLAISKQLVELMGGAIEVRSTVGEGSCFSFTVSLERGAGELADEAARDPGRPSPASRWPRAPRVLVVEDDTTSRLVAVELLTRLGCSAEAAVDGPAAIDALARAPYDLVLMDCQLPGLDGFEVTRRVRAGSAGARDPRIPIVAMSARAMRGDRDLGLAAGMNDYLTKPVESGALAAAIDRAIGYSRRRELPGQEVLAWDDLLDRVRGDRGLARKLVDAFLADMPGQLAALRGAVSAGSLPEAAARAHRIRGAAATVGGNTMRELARRIELAGHAADRARLDELVPALEAELDKLRQTAAAEGGPR